MKAKYLIDRLFEIENIDKPNITIALNPKEYYKRFYDHSDNKKHKGLKKSTPGMDFDSYSERLADINEFSKEFSKKPAKVEQKRFQIINESMQMKSVKFSLDSSMIKDFTFLMA